MELAKCIATTHFLKWISMFYLILFIAISVILTTHQYSLNKSNNKIKQLTSIVTQLKTELADAMKLMYTVQTNARVTVTHYSPDKAQKDNDPYITAFMARVKVGYVAVSRDLMDRGWTPGRRVYIPGRGVFIIADLMNKRKGNWVDVFVNTKTEADELGIERNIIASLFLEGLY